MEYQHPACLFVWKKYILEAHEKGSFGGKALFGIAFRTLSYFIENIEFKADVSIITRSAANKYAGAGFGIGANVLRFIIFAAFF